MKREEPISGRSRGWALGLANLLFLLGAIFLLAASCYAGYVALLNWSSAQDRFLAAQGLVSLGIPSMTPTATFTPTPRPTPTITPTPTPSPTPTWTPSPTPPPRPVQIKIPAIGVKTSIVSVPLVKDRRTGESEWDVDRLFRPGRKDLVGHLEGTALPGQGGNAVLTGHNYGYGWNSIFVHLGRLKKGDRITIVNEAGQSLAYEVVSVARLKWQRKNPAELRRHLEYLAPAGEERLTLVTCGGANIEPFPLRVYVVARPVDGSPLLNLDIKVGG
jgi:LPXTG-site transpeptidase (sortase) family protein